MLLKRKEVIKWWQYQSEEILNSYCCPNCRDLLFSQEGKLVCQNMNCAYGEMRWKFDIPEGEK